MTTEKDTKTTITETEMEKVTGGVFFDMIVKAPELPQEPVIQVLKK